MSLLCLNRDLFPLPFSLNWSDMVLYMTGRNLLANYRDGTKLVQQRCKHCIRDLLDTILWGTWEQSSCAFSIFVGHNVNLFLILVWVCLWLGLCSSRGRCRESFCSTTGLAVVWDGGAEVLLGTTGSSLLWPESRASKETGASRHQATTGWEPRMENMLIIGHCQRDNRM